MADRLEYLRKAAPLCSDNSGFLAEMATAYMFLGDMASSRRYAEEAVRTNPTGIMAHAVLKRIHKRREGRRVEALQFAHATHLVVVLEVNFFGLINRWLA